MIAALMLLGACGCETAGPPHSSLPTRDAATPAEETVVITGYLLYLFAGSGCH